jgi:single-stranded DNA-binding protein
MNKEKGTVVQITPLQVVSEKFKKQELTIKTENESYPQFITFQVVNDKCDLVANLNKGDVVEVSYNLRGREWNSPEGVTKYFNTIEAWSIVLTSKQEQNEVVDDLPF